ncbi:CBS domain-containing protein [Caldibacillus lycopersici]|uniref:CBS domain-containing protein n=1 Tax=Perspicuibacillus lycopersici TaxID=1325689 RepID=A0AAE3IR94_9BACI|nr:CBS domain-containing protein [Perspicuibacillus lycopersici]MCU9612228.1 CBS domain-containing protein [Perspicuibacillus lycopersici]
MIKIRDIMTTELETCSILDNIYEAALKMKQYNLGAIPVVDGDKLIGIITDRDIVIRGIAEKRSASSKVEKVMTMEMITIHADQSVEIAAKIMADHQIRRLPVVEDDRLIGIVSLGDIAVEEKTDHKAKLALSAISEQQEGEYFQ